MLCADYLSDDVPSLGPEQQHFFPGAEYNADILGPTAFECVNRIDGVYFVRETGVLVMTGWTSQRWWPGWNRWQWSFDGVTGAYLGRAPLTLSYYAQDIYQGASGELWVKYITGPIQMLDLSGSASGGEMIYPSFFGAIMFNALLIDRPRNRAVLNVDTGYDVQVHELTTGVLISRQRMPTRPRDICYGSGSLCYVLTESRDVFVLDYADGKVYGAVKMPAPDGATQNIRIAWNDGKKRLMAVPQPAGLGYQYSTHATGYRFKPIHTHVCTPIPLRRLRASVQTPMLIKAVGDLGEGLIGMVGLSAEAPLVASTVAVPIDGSGTGRAYVTPSDEGVAALTATMEVPCQL